MWIVQNISREQPTQRPLIYYPVHKREGYFSTYPLLKDSGCIGCSELQDCSRAVNMVMDKLQCDEKEASSVILESIPTESIDTLIESGPNSAMMILLMMSTSLMDAQLVKRKFYAHSSHIWQQTLMRSSVSCQISFSDRL